MSFPLHFFLKKKKRESVDQQCSTLASMAQTKQQSPNPSPTSSCSSCSRPTSVPMTAPTASLEPEELEDNRFYNYMRSHFNIIFTRSLVVCVPHSRSLDGVVLTKDFIESHSFNASPYFRGQCQAANSKVIAIEPPFIRTLSGFKEPRAVRIMTEEWVYVGMKKIRVLMVDRSLEGDPPIHQPVTRTITIPLIRNSKSDLDFLNLFPENAECLRELQLAVQEFVDTYVYIRGFNSYTVEKIQNIFVKTYKTILQRNRLLRDTCRVQSEHDHFMELVENVVMGFLHEKIWVRSLRAILQSQDNYLDAICHSYTNESITLRRYAVSHPIANMSREHFEDACLCLQGIESDSLPPLVASNDDGQTQRLQTIAFTPLEKVARLKATLDLISEAVNQYVESETGHVPPEGCVTTDEMIPLFAYVLVNSRISRIASVAFYIETFRLSHMERPEYSYTLVTLKSAIEFLKGDPLSLHDTDTVPSFSNTSSPILSPQLQHIRTRSTSFGSTLASSTQPSSIHSSSCHIRSVSASSRHPLNSLPPQTPAPSLQAPLHHKKSYSADLPYLMTTLKVSPSHISEYNGEISGDTPRMTVRGTEIMDSVSEGSKSIDISADWMIPTTKHENNESQKEAVVPLHRPAILSHLRPVVSTTFPSISSSTPLPTNLLSLEDVMDTATEANQDALRSSSPLADTPRMGRSLSASTTTKHRPVPQPPKVIDIPSRLSLEQLRRPESAIFDTRSLHNQEDLSDEELLGDFISGLQNMKGDIVGEHSGSFYSFHQ